MRLSTDADRDEERALATIAAGVEAGVTVFDTARSYGLDETELGHNERLLARALRACGAASRARIVTKGGMARPGGAWVPDGRARSIRADCEASLEALDGLQVDLYLLHAPDPRTPWRTSIRALARLVEDGLVRRIGLSNVNRGQLDDALAIAPIAAVQVSVSPWDDRALRGGVVERCEDARIAVIAHSPLGGPRRAAALARNDELAGVASAHGSSPAQVVLAWLLGLSPALIPIPGGRRPETARSAARAAALVLVLDDDDRARLERSLGRPRPRPAVPASGRRGGEVVLVMGIPGAGKSRIAAEYMARGHLRLNRDERGGSLRDVAAALEEALSSGSRRVVLDNTYLTRAARSHALETAEQHRVPTRCVWLDTPLAQAQVNLVERLLDRYGKLPSPEALKERSREPGVMAPTSQMRALRELEPPSVDEGFTSVQRVVFVREPPSARRRGGIFVAAGALDASDWRSAIEGAAPNAAHLLFDWRPEGSADDLAERVALLSAVASGPVEAALCSHGGGAPICWCRPPLPGLPLAFARSHGIDPARSTLIGTSTAHRTLATTLGARFVQVPPP
jgi:aryl-alcohol dehydrogenase-like predicted oxidoreductase/adenylate kinase family enzyme